VQRLDYYQVLPLNPATFKMVERTENISNTDKRKRQGSVGNRKRIQN
jgi:hypothetical protein